ncbi:hypothetical protein XPA_002443 [Xanthoria parietina]
MPLLAAAGRPGSASTPPKRAAVLGQVDRVGRGAEDRDARPPSSACGELRAASGRRAAR